MKKRSIKREFLPYWEWEEVRHNMWGEPKDKEEDLKRAIEFTGDHKLYGKWMRMVIKDWPKSCRHNLSNITQNRQAWIGHAAVAYALGIPEDIVRLAWRHLTEQQQILANKEADKAIAAWEEKNCRKDTYIPMFTMPE
jgi:hypothetical protein